MLPMLAKFLVVALMTSVVALLGLFAGVQPSSRLSCGPTVAPFGPHACSGTTPVFVVGSKAPITAVGVESVVGSTTSGPPSHSIRAEPAAQFVPAGFLAMNGIDT